MSRGLAWAFGLKMLSGNRRAGTRLVLSASLAMALGLVPLVLVLSIADGMIESISARTIETALYHEQIWRRGAPMSPEAGRRTVAQLVAGVDGVRGVWPEQQGFALAYGPSGGRLGLQVRGIDPGWAADRQGAGRYLKPAEGTLSMPDETSVWVGRDAARKLGLHPGDSLKLLTTRSRGALTLPRVTEVTIRAVVSVGYQELDHLWLFAPLALTQTVFDPQDQPVFWGLQADRPLAQTPQLTADLRRALGTGWQVVSWQTTGRSQFLNYQATRTLLAVVMALILLVAGVNVSTAMVATVGERRRETAILRALGASPTLVRRQFLVLGFGAGVLGTAVGLGLGMAAALAVGPLVQGADFLVNLFAGGGFHLVDTAYYLETIPVKFDPWVLAGAGVGSVALSVVASWWPAHRSARERPLDALRRA